MIVNDGYVYIYIQNICRISIDIYHIYLYICYILILFYSILNSILTEISWVPFKGIDKLMVKKQFALETKVVPYIQI